MIKFASKHFNEGYFKFENSYNHHPYTEYCTPEFMVKKLGWKKCKEIVLDCIDMKLSSKVIYHFNDWQYEFFCNDLQHLLSYYYKDIPKYY